MMLTIARLTAYHLHLFLRSYRYFAPITFYLIIIVWIYSVVPNPVMGSYSTTAVLLYLFASWLGINFFFTEPQIQQTLTAIHARRRSYYAVSRILSAWIMAVPLALAALCYPLIRGAFKENASLQQLAASLYGHLLLALLGVLLAYLVVELSGFKLISTLGWLFIAIALSLATISISEELPESLRWLLWLLPPASSIMRGLTIFDQLDALGTAAAFGFPLLYVILLSIFAISLPRLRKQ